MFETLFTIECCECGADVDITSEHFSGVFVVCSVCGATYQAEIKFISAGEQEYDDNEEQLQ